MKVEAEIVETPIVKKVPAIKTEAKKVSDFMNNYQNDADQLTGKFN